MCARVRVCDMKMMMKITAAVVAIMTAVAVMMIKIMIIKIIMIMIRTEDDGGSNDDSRVSNDNC